MIRLLVRLTPVLCLLLFVLGASADPGVVPAAAGPMTTAPVTDATVGYVALLREFGFPMFVTLWFMWRIEKRIDRFTEQIEKLITIVTVMTKVAGDK